jgi:hypothetical protein
MNNITLGGTAPRTGAGEANQLLHILKRDHILSV